LKEPVEGITLPPQSIMRAGLKPVPTHESVLCILTAKELVLGQENWYQSGTNSLLD